MTTVGGSLVSAHFLLRGDTRSSRNKFYCFDINRANKWVQADQSFSEPPRRRSAARLTSRLYPAAKLCPCHAKVSRHSSTFRLPNLRQANNVRTVASSCENHPSTRRHLLRAHPRRGHLDEGKLDRCTTDLLRERSSSSVLFKVS